MMFIISFSFRQPPRSLCTIGADANMTKWTLCPHFPAPPLHDLWSDLVVLLAVAVAVVVALEEEVLVAAVCRKCHRRDAEAGEAALETVPPRELAAVAPCLAVVVLGCNFKARINFRSGHNLLTLPRVVPWRAAGFAKGADVEARDIGLGAVGRP